MDAAHLGTGNRICSVVFVDLVRYSEEPVSKQAELKTRFDTLVAAALEHAPVADRLVLDTGDGAALCFLGDPEDALFAANTLRTGARDATESPALTLRMGINLGPVRVVKDLNGHSNVIGDGINVAQRVMSFAAPNQILVSRSYYEVVSRLSPEYAQLFSYVGLHRDKHVREHVVYEVQVGAMLRDLEREPTGIELASSASAEAGAASRFDPALIERLTTALALEMGPMAKLIVRRAAQRAADESALCDMLADNVPETKREAFRRALARAAATGPVSDPAQRLRAHGTMREIGPALLDRAELLLSQRIGPLARVLVREAARKAATPRELFERLALHIDDERARRLFLDEAERTT